MKPGLFRRLLAAMGLAAVLASATAEDIDIFSQNTTVTPDAPNVLILVDNTANWSQSFASSTKFAAEMTALQAVVNTLNAQFNLGIMMFTETGSGNTGNDGGYVRFSIQGMTDSTGGATPARDCLLKLVGGGATCAGVPAALDIVSDKSNGGKSGVTMGEVYDYFTGSNAYAGNNKAKADPLAFVSNTIAGPQYRTPILNGCQKNFLIIISNGPFQDNTSDTSTAMSQLGSAGGNTTIINPPDSSSNNNASDEWVRYLNQADLNGATAGAPNVVTYALEVGPSTTGQGPYNTNLLKSIGTQGKGGYYSAVDSASLLAALNRIFNDIQAVNSVFASASLPLSADNTGSFLNQVYIGVFRPDGGGKPRWYGNLKLYQFAVTNSVISLVDSAGTPAASGATGFAQPDAVSYWTSKDTTQAPDAAPTTGTGGFWYFDSKGSGGSYDSPDGEWVEKGGAAQQLRLAHLGYGGRNPIADSNATTGSRKVYTCTGSCLSSSGTALSSTPFDSTNTDITDAALGTASRSVTALTSASSITISSIYAGVPTAISALAKTGGIMTVTMPVGTDMDAAGLTAGAAVTISGVATNGYNGSYTIASVTGIAFTVANNGTGSATGGTVYSTSTTATVTTAANHGFSDAETVTISGVTPAGFNGVISVTSIDATHFKYTMSTALSGTGSGSTLRATSNKATVTSAAHGFSDGQSVTIAGATPTGYNGVYIVTTVDANTFTYVYPSAAPLGTSSGTITASIGGGRDTLLRWVRGQDTQNENNDTRTTDVRASIHGDVLHSRPVVINYGTTAGSDNVYVFYGSNDGTFRAITGGPSSSAGVEQWAFIPEEFFGKFLRQYDNSPQVVYPSTPVGLTPTPLPRDYTWDGPVSVYMERDADLNVTKAYLFIGVRRGGRFMYAIDVTTPTAPKFLWRKSSTDFAEWGQTWSQPQIAKIRARTNPVLIFGAGYDPATEDPEPNAPSGTDTMGRGIFVLDAFDGSLVWWAGNSANSPTLAVTGMNYSIAADATVVDRSLDGYMDRIYVPDVGGNVWRADIDDANTANWRVWKIAALSDRSVASYTNKRKFLFGAEVVFGEQFDSVLVGSGDREHPLETHRARGTTNRVYMFKDPNVGTVGANLCYRDGAPDPDPVCTTWNSASLFDATSSSSVPASAGGWYVTMASGEQVVNAPTVIAGTLFFGTNQPDPSNSSCSANLGIARRYAVSYLDGSATGLYVNSGGTASRYQTAVGGGLLPSPVGGSVEIGNGKYVFETDNPLNPGGAASITVNVPTKRYRVYWHEKLDQ
ncbi:MAG: hypothetical protein KF778_03805 [Rhodocyclaceae bacterium]|nr:hypothetical protein [Rhodocyclaceae bacterium]MBX3667504.1 hypothetical protein [Rhodocyclaceae bacterium]